MKHPYIFFLCQSAKNLSEYQNLGISHISVHCFHLFFILTLTEVPKLSSYAKAEDKLFKYLFGNYQKWVRPVDHLNQTIRVKFGLAISQLVDVVRIRIFQSWFGGGGLMTYSWIVLCTAYKVKNSIGIIEWTLSLIFREFNPGKWWQFYI